MIKNKNGFTLTEMLVVVLIIGILAAVAIPQYKEAVEKSIMQEAIINLKAIADANERFYMLNNRYAKCTEMDKLDVVIPGEIKGVNQTGLAGERIITKNFIYAPNYSSQGAKAVAHRIKEGVVNSQAYYMAIRESDNKLRCTARNSDSNPIQKKLCNKILNEGHL